MGNSCLKDIRRHARQITLLAAGLGTNVFLAIHLLFPNRVPLVQQLVHIAHWITLSGVIGLLASLFLRRHRWIGVLFFPAIVAFIVWYGRDFLPKSIPQVEGTDIRVLTHNSYYLNEDPAAVIKNIVDFDADIVALQEVSPWVRLAIRRELTDAYPYQAYFLMQSFEMVGILSRYPIIEQETRRDDLTIIKRDEPRFLRVVLDVDGQRVVVYNFHPFRPRFQFLLRYDDNLNRLNYDLLLENLATETDPVLVLCDCNATPRTEQYGWMKARLQNIRDAVGWGLGLTHPGIPEAWMPFRNVRLDHIWYSEAFTAIDTRVGDSQAGSDHYPLYGQLVLRRATS